MKSFAIVSIFAEMFTALEHGITGRAIQQGLISTKIFNPRDYTTANNRRVDDRPYGGGPGMLLMVQALRDTIKAAKDELGAATPVIYLSPQGKTLTQAGIAELTALPDLILLAGRYEGIDQRVINSYVDREVSIGDYVLSGGELPAMVLIDAITRLIPGALGDAESAAQDSFMTGLLDCPHYTRPEEIDGQIVPKVLLSGDHAAIAKWRLKQALGRTWLLRPDLLNKLELDANQQNLLNEFIDEHRGLSHD